MLPKFQVHSHDFSALLSRGGVWLPFPRVWTRLSGVSLLDGTRWVAWEGGQLSAQGVADISPKCSLVLSCVAYGRRHL